MEYFQFLSSGYGAICGGVVNREEKVISTGSSVGEEEELLAYIDNDDDRPVGDLVYNCSPIVLSAVAYDVFKLFTMPIGTRFLPLTIVRVGTDADGQEITSMEPVGPGYGILLDWHKSEIMAGEDEEAFFKLPASRRVPGRGDPPVVLKSSVESFDLVNGGGIGNLCSERLKVAIEQSRLTNFAFFQVRLR